METKRGFRRGRRVRGVQWREYLHTHREGKRGKSYAYLRRRDDGLSVQSVEGEADERDGVEQEQGD